MKGHIAGDASTTTGHGLYSGGGYHNAYNNLILHGDASTGSSGIAFISDSGGINVNQPSDRAFIQYHPYGVSAATKENTNPTLASTGEAGRLVIGVGNDATDELWLQAPDTNGIKHIKATSSGVDTYIILDTGNWKSNLNLNVSDTIDNTKYVSGVSEADGKITVSRNTFSPAVTIGAGTASATPTVKITIAGNNSSAQSITMATTGVYGATKLSSTSSSSEQGLAATPKLVYDSIAALDVASVGGSGKYISAISETDGKISATVTDTAVSNTWTNGTTKGPKITTTVNGVAGTAVAIPLNSKSYSGVIPRGSGNANCVWKTDSTGTPAWREDSASAPIFENITLLASGWSNGEYRVESLNATADSIQICSLPDYTYASSDEMDALGSAKLVDGGQGAGYFILKALGDVPTIDIDILVLFQYSTDGNLSYMTSAAASANAAAASAAQAAASAKVQRKTVSFSSVTSDTSVSPYKYKYEVAWTGVTANDWVDGSGITDQDWAIESAANKVILRFTNNITSSKTVTCYWATTQAS